MDATSCFISYSWDSESHKNWVLRFAEELQKNGVYVHLDQWDIKFGMDLPRYMEERVRESHFVLLICSPTFAQKANSGKGGVGYEKAIVTGEIFTGAPRETKFIPILRSGKPIDAIPSYLKSKVFVDMRNDAEFVERTKEVVRHIHDIPMITRPPLGLKPERLTATESAAAKDPKKVKPKKPFDMEEFKALRDFAYGSEGLNLDARDATKWAEARMNDGQPFDMIQFRKLRDYAYSSEGLNLDPNGAVKWAEARMNDAHTFDLEHFKELRNYAYGSEGLNLEAQDAVTWAEARLNDIKSFDMQKFVRLRNYAYSSEGLDLDPKASVEWALSKLEE